MDQRGYAQFVTAQGFGIVVAGGELWVEKRYSFFENIPPHRSIHVSRSTAANLFLRGASAIRYTCKEGEGQPTYEYVCDEKGYDLHCVKTRNITRQGLRNCEIKPISFDLLRGQGFDICGSVFARQRRRGPHVLASKDLWNRYMEACARIPDVEPWGAFSAGELCAFLLVVTVEDYAYLYHPFAKTDALKLRPMNALIFSVVREVLARPGVTRVSFGLEPFSKSSLEQFKLAMGFSMRRLSRNIRINPIARPLFGKTAEAMIERLFRTQPGAIREYLDFSRSLRDVVPD